VLLFLFVASYGIILMSIDNRDAENVPTEKEVIAICHEHLSDY